MSLRSALRACAGIALVLGSSARHKKYPPVGRSGRGPGSRTSPCDSTIPGYWTGFFPGPLGDEYKLSWAASPGAWTAVYINPIPGGWKNATGQFSSDNTTVAVFFDTGLNLTGSVDTSCAAITWDNDSMWKAVPPVPCSAVIPGPWAGYDPQPTGAEYSLTWANPPAPGAWAVTYLNAPVGPSWTAGVGQLSADNLTTTLLLNSGGSLRGTVSGGCSTITWDDGSNWKAVPAPPLITDVHIVAMNHLDVGYNGIPILGLINNILNIYFDTYFPRAISVANTLREQGGPARLIYTTHAWLVHMYLHCPANFTLNNITLACPTPAEQAALVAAIQRGDIVFHAGAFNTEYENAFNAEMLDVQFQLARDLADELGVPRPQTLSLRDVPGTTRALIPHLVRNNITALSIGVNPFSPAPAMPNPGVWKDPTSGTSVLYMQTGQGQGYPWNPGPDPVNCGGMCAASCVVFPPLTHALCWAFRGDNSGPPMNADEVNKQFDIARWQFLGANVYASTFDNFTAQLATVAALLPESQGEVGDTWITSTNADPWKLTFYRVASRAYAECIQSGQCDIHDPRVLGFTRLLAKIPEHTYGLPGVDDSSNWTNEQFHAAIAAGEQAYLDALHSYTEQRDIATVLGLGYLGDHPLAANISATMAALAPVPPNVSDYAPVPPASWAQPFVVGPAVIAFDGTTGAIVNLTLAGVAWADAAHPLAQYIYQTYNDSDYDAQSSACCYGDGGRQAVANPQQTTTTPIMTGLWRGGENGQSFVASLVMPAEQHEYYGAPSIIWMNVTVSQGGASVDIDLQLFNKTATRLGEAHFFHFLPVPQGGDYAWAMDKLGSWVDPLDAVENGSVHVHAVGSGVIYRSTSSPATRFFAIDTLDAPIVNPATAAQPATMFPVPLSPLTGPVLGFDVELMQNAFSTNTPQFTWDPAYRFRFVLRASQE